MKSQIHYQHRKLQLTPVIKKLFKNYVCVSDNWSAPFVESVPRYLWSTFGQFLIKKKKIHIPMKKVQLSFEMDERKTFQDIFIDTL